MPTPSTASTMHASRGLPARAGSRERCGLALALVTAAAVAFAQEPDEEPPAVRWWKGNTHTHTLNSDGDSPPGEVAHWYRDHGYDFLVLSDHNYYTVIDELQREFDRESERLEKRRFLLLPGEEVTDQFDRAAIHINGFDTSRLVGPRGGKSKRETLQRNIDAIHEAGGIPSVNHPNFYWSLTADDLASLERLRHFEIYNGHPGVHNFGGGGHPSLEDMWDDILSRNVRLFGVAVDDAHHFQKWGPRESNPGKGWIMLRAPALERDAIRAAFDDGAFYCSTGVTLEELEASGRTLRLRIAPEGMTRFTTFYIGKHGRLLAKETEMESSYTLKDDDLYVRARVVSSLAEFAWSQPLYLSPPGK